MDRDLIEAKIESLRHCIGRIASKTPASADQLAGDPDLQDIIALNLQRAVQLCVDLAAHVIADTNVRPPSTMAENFVILKELSVIHPALAEGMMKAVGFRNIAVHSYQAIDWKNRLSDLPPPPRRLQTICSVNHSPAAIFLTLLQSRFLCPPRMEEMPNIHDQSCLIAHGEAGAARSSSAEATSAPG